MPNMLSMLSKLLRYVFLNPFLQCFFNGMIWHILSKVKIGSLSEEWTLNFFCLICIWALTAVCCWTGWQSFPYWYRRRHACGVSFQFVKDSTREFLLLHMFISTVTLTLCIKSYILWIAYFFGWSCIVTFICCLCNFLDKCIFAILG